MAGGVRNVHEVMIKLRFQDLEAGCRCLGSFMDGPVSHRLHGSAGASDPDRLLSGPAELSLLVPHPGSILQVFHGSASPPLFCQKSRLVSILFGEYRRSGPDPGVAGGFLNTPSMCGQRSWKRRRRRTASPRQRSELHMFS